MDTTVKLHCVACHRVMECRMGNVLNGQAFPFCDNQFCNLYSILQTGIIYPVKK